MSATEFDLDLDDILAKDIDRSLDNISFWSHDMVDVLALMDVAGLDSFHSNNYVKDTFTELSEDTISKKRSDSFVTLSNFWSDNNISLWYAMQREAYPKPSDLEGHLFREKLKLERAPIKRRPSGLKYRPRKKKHLDKPTNVAKGK